jgi:hypothetical protein
VIKASPETTETFHLIEGIGVRRRMLWVDIQRPHRGPSHSRPQTSSVGFVGADLHPRHHHRMSTFSAQVRHCEIAGTAADFGDGQPGRQGNAGFAPRGVARRPVTRPARLP